VTDEQATAAVVAALDVLADELRASLEAERAVEADVIPAGSAEAVRVAAILQPASFARVPRPDPFAALDLDASAFEFKVPDWP
jgi:hypothetical protein